MSLGEYFKRKTINSTKTSRKRDLTTIKFGETKKNANFAKYIIKTSTII